MADAEIYEKTVDDRVLILNTRAQVVQGFRATNWVDLRIGFWLSLTDETADDTITGLAETLTSTTTAADRYWIGIKDRTAALPKTAEFSGTFIGFTNANRQSGTNEDTGDSVLSSSDIGVGTSNTNYWRPNNVAANYFSFMVIDGRAPLAFGGTATNALAQHFPQNTGGAGGYCVLLGFRLTRPSAGSNTITVEVKSDVHSADMLYTSVPENDLLRTNLAITPWPASMTIGPVELTSVPDAFYCYWPFLSSRLRIHGLGLLKSR